MRYNKKVVEWKHKQDIKLYKWEIGSDVVEDETLEQISRSSKSRTSYNDMTAKAKEISNRRRKSYYKNRIFFLADLAIHNELNTFITLTFKEPIMDYLEARHEWDLFIKRLKYRVGKDLKYIAVHELQKKRGGVYHFHVLTNLGFFPHNELEKIWGKGFVYIESLNRDLNTDKIRQIMYSFKYICKEVIDENTGERNTARKIYTSRNLVKPIVRKEYSTENMEDIIFKNMEHVISTNTYEIRDSHNRKLNEVDCIKIAKDF